MSMRRSVLVFAALCGLAACSDPPPPGGDLLLVTCNCSDTCAGDAVFVRGEICTETTVPDNVDTAKQFICDQKETLGFNVCKIENCVPFQAEPILDGCPEDNGDFHAGDFAQATSSAVDPSVVHVGGDDIIDFSLTPEEFIVTTTQSGSSLFFGSFVGSLGTTEFESDGIFVNADHTLSEGRISGGPFAVALAADGTFTIPPGAGNFIVTGKIDGDRLSLTITTLDLHGRYDEALGIFELEGTVQAVGADISLSVDLVFAFVNRPPRPNAGPDQTVECDSGQQTAAVHLSGSATDFDGADDITRYSWFVDAGPEVSTATEVDLAVPVGAHEVTLAVADQAGSFGGDVAIVTVRDTIPPVVACPGTFRVEADPTTCIGALPDLGAQTVITDVCTPAGGFTVVQDPPDGTPLAVGQHVVEIEATDAQGLASPCSTLVTVSLPINRSPDVVRYLDAQLGDDFLRVHGRISPCAPLDPSLTEFEVTLSNAHGDIYRATLPVGAIKKKGRYRWLYRDRSASIRHDGIRNLRITYSPARDRYQIRLHTFGDLSLATEARMTLELRFDGGFFATTNDWRPASEGWQVRNF